MTTDRTLAVASPSFTLKFYYFFVFAMKNKLFYLFFCCCIFEDNWGPLINIYKTNQQEIHRNKYVQTYRTKNPS